MPTNRKRVSRKMAHGISENLREYLLTGYCAKGDAKVFMLASSPDRLRPVWSAVKNDIMADFVKEHPCQRPWPWWEFEAPKEPVPGWDHERFNSAQRRRLGGIGTPLHEVTCSWGGFPYGIPSSWVDQWQVDYYNGRALDINGNPIGTEYKEGDFEGVAIDPDNPPCFQSVAAYLERHGLLSPTEKAYLKKHPELLEPEKIEFEENEEG